MIRYVHLVFHHFSDLTKEQFKECLREAAAEFSREENKILFTVIMTHGEENGVLFCSDGKEIKLMEVLAAFQSIQGKPKVGLIT